MAQPLKKQARDLAQEIRQFRAELDKLIEAKTADLKASYPTLPESVLRLDLLKHRTCQCQVALEILSKN